MEEILLDLKNVRKQYANFSLECSMQVKRGSITGLIGANGAGRCRCDPEKDVSSV